MKQLGVLLIRYQGKSNDHNFKIQAYITGRIWKTKLKTELSSNGLGMAHMAAVIIINSKQEQSDLNKFNVNKFI